MKPISSQDFIYLSKFCNTCIHGLRHSEFENRKERDLMAFDWGSFTEIYSRSLFSFYKLAKRSLTLFQVKENV